MFVFAIAMTLLNTPLSFSSSSFPQESLDNRGQKLEVEMAAYEARMFSEMLLKGAVNIVEVQ